VLYTYIKQSYACYLLDSLPTILCSCFNQLNKFYLGREVACPHRARGAFQSKSSPSKIFLELEETDQLNEPLGLRAMGYPDLRAA